MRRNAARILDEYLAASARAGDRHAFDQLAKRWHPKLLAHAYRLTGEPEAAGDAVQEGWADIVRGLPRLKDASAFPAWAYRIVTRRVADQIRGRQRDRALSANYAAEPTPSWLSSAGVEAVADRSPLVKAINNLPPDQRAAIALFYLEEFTVAEIAAALSAPVGTIKTRLMNARRKLRLTFEERKSHVET